MEIIQSKNNPLYKKWLAAIARKGDWGNAYFLEGWRLCRDALDAGAAWQVVSAVRSEATLNNMTINEVWQNVRKLNPTISTLVLADHLFARLSATVNSQGLAFLVVPQQIFNPKFMRRVLVLENVQDPGNLGAIWRSADAFGFDAIVTVGGVKPNNSKVLRSAMGSIFHVPTLAYPDIVTAYADLRAGGFWLGAASLSGEPVENVLPNQPLDKVAIVIGNEGNGLSMEAVKAADRALYIPIIGRAESLNAACAAGILCYLYQAKG